MYCVVWVNALFMFNMHYAVCTRTEENIKDTLQTLTPPPSLLIPLSYLCLFSVVYIDQNHPENTYAHQRECALFEKKAPFIMTKKVIKN